MTRVYKVLKRSLCISRQEHRSQRELQLLDFFTSPDNQACSTTQDCRIFYSISHNTFVAVARFERARAMLLGVVKAYEALLPLGTNSRV